MSEKISKDNVYIKGIIAGDGTILREIYESYHKAIFQLVSTNQGTEEDAKDVFQEGIMLMYQKLQSADFQMASSFFTYFYAVCRNIWSNKRRKKSFGEVSLTDEITSMYKEVPEAQFHQSEQYTLYRKKFLELGAECQQILSLFFAKTKMTEIVEKMNFSSVSYAKKRKFICKERLVNLIQGDASYFELKH